MALSRTPEDAFVDLPNYDFEPHRIAIDAPGDPEMAYVDAGPADSDETFLCLHGEPTWGFLYRDMIPILAERGRVVVPDFLGFGRSDKYTDRSRYSFRLHYDALGALVETLDLANVTLVCQDWGGILGLPVAIDQPERFARLVPMNTDCPTGEQRMVEEWERFRSVAEESETLDVSRIVDGGTTTTLDDRALAAYDAPFPDEASKAGARAWPDLVPRAGGGDGASITRTARERLADWPDPAFVLFSDRDPILRYARDPLRELIPAAADQPDVWIEGAGHFLQEDAGPEIAREIVAFVDRT